MKKLTEKFCKKCEQILPVNKFRNWKQLKNNGKDHYTKYDSYCKICRGLYALENKLQFYKMKVREFELKIAKARINLMNDIDR